MKVLDLFSGIGGFSLGLEAAGMKTVAFCERELFCQAVLKKHWPDVPCHDDVKTLDGSMYEGIDVVCGGFPCQDISLAGKGAGLAGERSGLWFEYRRIVKEARPRYVIIENVAALRSRGLEEVLGSLAEIGYDAEWHCIPASAVGAPHRRDRVWIVGYSDNYGRNGTKNRKSFDERGNKDEAWSNELVKFKGSSSERETDVGYSDNNRLERIAFIEKSQRKKKSIFADSKIAGTLSQDRTKRNFWNIEPNVGRVADGIPLKVHRLKSLGNSIVPQIAQIIGEAIMQNEI